MHAAKRPQTKRPIVIDLPAWDKAAWKGAGYLQISPDQPPVIALLFQGEKAARHIFSRWRERFGKVAREHDIHIAIIREHGENNTFHYIMQIAAKPPADDDFHESQNFILASRCIEITPPNNCNMDFFLARLAEHGRFWLMPATVTPGMVGEPNLLTDSAILKRDVSVKYANEVCEQDVEGLALRQVRSYARNKISGIAARSRETAVRPECR